ncbi:MAG: hypothetical protein FWE27_09170 [Defluviitaleaceae bacterium]|nr:hypothetical protein [Defluviitaleaceae bacterium]
MDNYTIFTNNSIVAEYFSDKAPTEVKWIASPAIDVLSAAKSAAHLGAVILSNPMSGVQSSQHLFGPSGFERPPVLGRSSSPPKIRSINPYLSILASPSLGTVDFISVKNIDEALTLYKKNARLRFAAHNDETIKKFQAADLETLLTTITALESIQ